MVVPEHEKQAKDKGCSGGDTDRDNAVGLLPVGDEIAVRRKGIVCLCRKDLFRGKAVIDREKPGLSCPCQFGAEPQVILR